MAWSLSGCSIQGLTSPFFSPPPPPPPPPPRLHTRTSRLKISLCIISCSIKAGHVSQNSSIDPVVSTDWVSRNLADVSILDIRGNVETNLVEDGVEKSEYVTCYDDYLEGHIPGAVFVDWVTDGVDRSCNIPVQLTTDSEEFTVLMERKGVSTEKHVVVYDCGDGLLAPRLWWALVMHGHPSVYVLDGGWKKWTEEGREIELDAPCPLKIYAKFEPRQVKYIPWISSWGLLSLISQKRASSSETPIGQSLAIIDARSAGQYNGIIRRSKHSGRIPNAINLPQKLFLQPSCMHKSVDEQRKLFLDAGVNPDHSTRLIAYCNGGVASCTILLAWVRVGGSGTWANYDGSWNEWGNADDLPRE